MVDIKVIVFDGSFHDVDSSEMSFKIAGSLAVEAAARKAEMTLLEPIMKVEVSTPDEFMGDVIGDINARRGEIQSVNPKGPVSEIKAKVPLKAMFGYSTDLRSSTQGRAIFSMIFSEYNKV